VLVPLEPCDAAPILLCVPESCDGICVSYRSESEPPSCSAFEECVATTLECTPGDCTAECAAALCPEPYACEATSSADYFACVRP
jgi:hypothetical protein